MKLNGVDGKLTEPRPGLFALPECEDWLLNDRGGTLVPGWKLKGVDGKLKEPRPGRFALPKYEYWALSGGGGTPGLDGDKANVKMPWPGPFGSTEYIFRA
jgi:hypothetical protein